MGNEHSTTSTTLLANNKSHHLRKMSKAQSSTLLTEMGNNNNDKGKVENSLSSPIVNSRKVSGAYIKHSQSKQLQQQQMRQRSKLAEAGRTNKLEKQSSTSSSSRGSQDYSSGEKEESSGGTATAGSGTPVLLAKKHNMKNNWLAKHRKESYCSEIAVNGGGLTVQQQQQQKRQRSASLCATQMKADCQAIAALSYQHALGNGVNGMNARKASTQGVMPALTRLRIQQCFRNAKPVIGHQILKRASTLRPEFKSFLGHLREEKADELANDIYVLVTECVANVELPSHVAATSFAFGEMHAQLCHVGFRPDFFSVIADATIAECVRLDGGTQKRCETLLAWSQLMQFMFSNVRDGYYAEVRQQRRSSLPQQRLLLKQASLAKVQQQQPQQEEEKEGRVGGSPLEILKERKRVLQLQQSNISFDMDL